MKWILSLTLTAGLLLLAIELQEPLQRVLQDHHGDEPSLVVEEQSPHTPYASESIAESTPDTTPEDVAPQTLNPELEYAVTPTNYHEDSAEPEWKPSNEEFTPVPIDDLLAEVERDESVDANETKKIVKHPAPPRDTMLKFLQGNRHQRKIWTLAKVVERDTRSGQVVTSNSNFDLYNFQFGDHNNIKLPNESSQYSYYYLPDRRELYIDASAADAKVFDIDGRFQPTTEGFVIKKAIRSKNKVIEREYHFRQSQHLSQL